MTVLVPLLCTVIVLGVCVMVMIALVPLDDWQRQAERVRVQ